MHAVTMINVGGNVLRTIVKQNYLTRIPKGWTQNKLTGKMMLWHYTCFWIFMQVSLLAHNTRIIRRELYSGRLINQEMEDVCSSQKQWICSSSCNNHRSEQPTSVPAVLKQRNKGALPSIYNWIRSHILDKHHLSCILIFCVHLSRWRVFRPYISWSTGDGVVKYKIQLSSRKTCSACTLIWY